MWKANEGIAEEMVTIEIGKTTCCIKGFKVRPINVLTNNKRTTNITKFAIIATTKTVYAAPPIINTSHDTIKIAI